MIIHGGSVSWEGGSDKFGGYYSMANYEHFSRWSWAGNRTVKQRMGFPLPGALEWQLYGVYL